jgi:hypothetical protein
MITEFSEALAGGLGVEICCQVNRPPMAGAATEKLQEEYPE